MRSLLQLATSTTIFSGSVYAYLWYKTNKNMKQYQQILEAGTLKDASRLSNQSYGISWGFQADDIVMSKIDSSDYLFMKFDCDECLTVPEYLKCFMDNMFRLEEEFDSVGYAYRNIDGLYILYNEFGETKVRQYPELVGLPYLKGLIIQKTKAKQRERHLKLKRLLEREDGRVEVPKVSESAVEMVNRVNRQLEGESAQDVTDLSQLVESSQQILVRTETNRTLRSL